MLLLLLLWLKYDPLLSVICLQEHYQLSSITYLMINLHFGVMQGETEMTEQQPMKKMMLHELSHRQTRSCCEDIVVKGVYSALVLQYQDYWISEMEDHH